LAVKNLLANSGDSCLIPALEKKEMANYSSFLAWGIPWTEGPDGLHIVHGVA